MKTAMQELKDWANQYKGQMISADQVVLQAHKLLKKEKEQIIEAYEAAMERPIENYAESYYNMNYNQTYNQKEETLEEWKSKFTHHCAVKNNQNK